VPVAGGSGSVLRPRPQPRAQVPRQSLSVRRLRIRGRAYMSRWCPRLLSDGVKIERGSGARNELCIDLLKVHARLHIRGLDET
jgi:hypothetical protein